MLGILLFKLHYLFASPNPIGLKDLLKSIKLFFP